ncbi:ATP-binding cassette domain-containing protein [Herbiconiux moechotypicola]|uniref:ATP-binding cassette domain-containing protein n=1 Tax=Herbiconiux moechotypicola TaxID=637393 RepID=A0ABN3DA91_9MICO|nr:ATP-binding cassette domain-containing protein [Herbiconiux moechotypicola]MCS5729022.1 ATP-binding cassette domain-containing protein [Herbiconiux moechotypicola]
MAETAPGTAKPLLEARGVVKRYGHVEALGGADFTVYPGEVVSLIGDNGAGKSTLVKILSGAVQRDGGELLLDGEEIHPKSPVDVQNLGIETVYQDLALAPELSASANLYLGRELMKPAPLGWFGALDNKRMLAEAMQNFTRLGVNLRDPRTAVANLSGGQRQSVAVARAAVWATKLIMLDEPTAALGVEQTRRVLDLIRRVSESGIAVVLISHNMPDVLAVSDRIEVLRLGKRVAQFTAGHVKSDDLISAMTGAATFEGTK